MIFRNWRRKLNRYKDKLKLNFNLKEKLMSRKFWLNFFRISLILMAIGVLAVVGLFVWYSRDLPSPEKVVRRDGYSSKLYDRNGNILYDIYDQGKRDPVSFDKIPDYLKQATIAVEDKDFYKHKGFDPLTPFRIIKNFFYFGKVTGGSTLTQQLARTVLLTTDRTVNRKIKELILSIQIDAKYSKDEILRMYLNEVPYGGASWGVGPATEQYFNKPLNELNLAECVILAGLPQLRKQYGADLNQLKTEIQKKLDSKQIQKSEKPTPAYSSGGSKKPTSPIFGLPKIGHLHPITQTERQLNDVFLKLGFSLYCGPEIVTDEFNFKRLNVPPNHPARDMQDSIYIKEPEYLLRTQTSTIESYLLAQKNKDLPIRAAFAGSTFRNEKVNRSNHFVFHQYQAVVVDKEVTIKDLIGTMDLMFKTLYGPDVVVRYRCKYYPEVEPGVGPDMQCFSCHGSGCPLCKYAGWIEMGGAGMIHPKVLQMAQINPKIWSGFAFGMGLDRWTMAQKNIKDIRTLMGGNLAYKPNQP